MFRIGLSRFLATECILKDDSYKTLKDKFDKFFRWNQVGDKDGYELTPKVKNIGLDRVKILISKVKYLE